MSNTSTALCPDGLEEYIARTGYEAEPRGAQLIGDAMRFERETMADHTRWCVGCVLCSDSLERESDL